MKKAFICIVLIFSAVSVGADTIILKNGGKFKTDNYWEENGRIYFLKFGQKIGVRKSSVLRIEGDETQKDDQSKLYGIADIDKNVRLEDLDSEYRKLVRESTALFKKKGVLARELWEQKMKAFRKKAIYFAKKTGYCYDKRSKR